MTTEKELIAELLEACKQALRTLDAISIERASGTTSNQLVSVIKKVETQKLADQS